MICSCLMIYIDKYKYKKWFHTYSFPSNKTEYIIIHILNSNTFLHSIVAIFRKILRLNHRMLQIIWYVCLTPNISNNTSALTVLTASVMECKLYFFFKDYSFHFILIFLIGWGFMFGILRWVYWVRVSN